VDQLLADEELPLPPPGGRDEEEWIGTVIYTLADMLGTIRDLATHDSTAHTTTVEVHRRYDAYGNLTQVTDGIGNLLHAHDVDCVFGFTGRLHDAATGFGNNTNRWYDPVSGTWTSQDPIGFAGDPSNLYRYVGNSPVEFTDSSGLWISPYGGNGKVYGGNGGPYGGNGHIYGDGSRVGSLVGVEVYWFFPFGWHYNRNRCNFAPLTEQEAIAEGFQLQPPEASRFHRIGKGNENNKKYMSRLGHYEAVYKDGKLVTDSTNCGTFNFYDYRTDPVKLSLRQLK